MKSNTFSIVVGDDKCNARCPFCVAKMTGQVRPVVGLNVRRLDTACKIAKQSANGFCTAMITGKGEPLLFPGHIEAVLYKLQEHNFPVIELQTNGVLIDRYKKVMAKWQGIGLDLVCISIAADDPESSNCIMGISGDYRYPHAVDTLHELGFSVRLNVTMTRQGLHTTKEFNALLARCHRLGVEQLTLREVTMPNCCGPTAEWVKKNIPTGFSKVLGHYIEMHGGTRLLVLPHGGVVYDICDQNVCVTNCLTGSTDPDDTRQIIYFPDGRIAYDWRYAGARIL
jgi:molybdenum cofactor biosynthesis enzyme MoaA